MMAAAGMWALSGRAASEDEGLPTYVDVERAVNGHYLKTDNGPKILLLGIRAPYENEPGHAEAKTRVEALTVGKEIRLRFERTAREDDEGRLLAYAFDEDRFVNETLVREGLAFVRLTEETQRFADGLLSAQHEAMKKKRGIWKGVLARAKESKYPADPKYGDFHRPACEVASRINPERKIEFSRREEAFSRGFAPCNKCQP